GQVQRGQGRVRADRECAAPRDRRRQGARRPMRGGQRSSRALSREVRILQRCQVTWTTLSVLSWTASRFAERGLPSARLEAEVLLAHVLKTNPVALYTRFTKPPQGPAIATYPPPI